ncbi:hypothetical protein E2C01_001058 [Portunus trituberculatus]|uniref:Uncharacterized protein n=1 Tax=Portunus trituberculatus TaxID=210409 RepID=A0A5B7CIA6_PORTR|nr:hypothetical protein [Portunus trituberculatus]
MENKKGSKRGDRGGDEAEDGGVSMSGGNQERGELKRKHKEPLEIRQNRVSAFLIIEAKSTWLVGTNEGLGQDVARLLEDHRA